MFTGLIEAVGEVVECTRTGDGQRLRIRSPLAPALAPGDSLAVNGVCLTVVLIAPAEIQTDVGPETLRVTTLGSLTRGAVVNLERPLRADSRLGGHFVQGHVDAVTRQRYLRKEGEFVRVGFSMPEGLERFLVAKGSVAINGVSLTVASLDDEGFDVQLVPHTLLRTNLTSEARAGALNVEVDILGKYVAKMLEGHLRASAPGAAANGAEAGGPAAAMRFIEPAGGGR